MIDSEQPSSASSLIAFAHQVSPRTNNHGYMAFSNENDLWQEFLANWPIERLRSMQLSDYTNAGGTDSFVYWMESRLDVYGSMWGGSAFKFGIYSRRKTKKEDGDTSRLYDDSYGWYRKFGLTSAEAFEAVRKEVLKVAVAAREGRLSEIDGVDLGNTYKWKIAFHYQPLDAPTIACMFQRKPLLFALKMPLNERDTPLSQLYERLGKQRPSSESILEFSKRMWQAAVMAIPYEVRLPEPAVKKGVIPLGLVSAPFPAAMIGGSKDTDAKQKASFQTDTGLRFESDIRETSLGKGEVRHNLSDYFAKIGAVKGTPIVITPRQDGSYFISSRGAPLRDDSDGHAMPVDLRKTVKDPSPHVSRPPLNQILFGPPGTGKTFHAIDKVLEILDPQFLREHAANRAELKSRFDVLAKEGLAQFVTFHQSFSYEDFVEGLRADADSEAGGLRYEVVDGVFKRLCEAARLRVVKAEEAAIDPRERRIWKLSLGDSTTERWVYDECVQKGYALLGAGFGADFSKCDTREKIRQTMEFDGEPRSNTDAHVTAVNTFVRVVEKGDLVVVTEGNLKFRAIGEITGDYRHLDRPEGDTYAQCRDVRWLRVYAQARPYEDLMANRFSQLTLYELREGSIELDKLSALLQPAPNETTSASPRVLIIDEINRGNVSRVFGELITLIEPSKRTGAAEALEVTLPYSKKSFSVPDNVHIIGTMNTADRSLAGLDIALRRRFQFVEMPPRPELLSGVTIAGVNLGQLLGVMNQRIEALLDRDHQLGHAYFMELKTSDSVDSLAKVFRNQILPLLQEYFFEDWQRIAWVLNDHRKAKGCQFVVQQTVNSSSLFGGGVDVDTEAKLWRVDDTAFLNAASYIGIVSDVTS